MEWIYIVNRCLLSVSIFLKVTAATEMCRFLSSSCSYDCPFLSPRSCTRSRSYISRQGSGPIYCYLCDNRNLTCFLTSWAFCFQNSVIIMTVITKQDCRRESINTGVYNTSQVAGPLVQSKCRIYICYEDFYYYCIPRFPSGAQLVSNTTLWFYFFCQRCEVCILSLYKIYMKSYYVYCVFCRAL